MSVKAHEAYCLDSAQDRLLFYDDFLGDSLRDLWTAAGTDSAAVVDAQDGGIIRLTTGAASGNNYSLNWNSIRSLHVNKKVTIEARIEFETITNMGGYLVLRFDDANRIYFRYDNPTDDTIQIFTTNGGAPTSADTGITPDTDPHIYRIECFPTDEVHFYYDGVVCTNSPITTNIPDDAADYLQPQVRIYTRENAAHYIDADYVGVRQEI